jgi:hypothetical protein
MNFKNGVKIQKPLASLTLRQESNFSMFKNLFLKISGRKYYIDEEKCIIRSSIIFKVNRLLWG